MRSLGLIEPGHSLSNRSFRDLLQREFQRLSGEQYTAPVLSITVPCADALECDGHSLSENLQDCVRRLGRAGVDGFALAHPGWYRHADAVVQAGASPLLDPMDELFEELALRQIAPPAIIGIVGTCDTTANRLAGRGYRVIRGNVSRRVTNGSRPRHREKCPIVCTISGPGATFDAPHDTMLDVTALHAAACARWILQDAFSAIGSR